MFDYKGICETISHNINGRKLVLRCQHNQFEKALFDNLGMKADMRVTRNPSRQNGVDIFSDEIILEKSDQYYLVITEEMTWNSADADRYLKAGYRDEKDILWICPKPEVIETKSEYFTYSDIRGNMLEKQTFLDGMGG